MLSLVQLPEGRVRVLEVGCGKGKDVLSLLAGDARYQLWGVDILPRDPGIEGVHFVQADAEHLPFADGSFDLVITVGVLEHIEPVEKLCAVIAELDRVGRHQISVVPSISTPIEPHCGALCWPLRAHGTSSAYSRTARCGSTTCEITAGANSRALAAAVWRASGISRRLYETP